MATTAFAEEVKDKTREELVEALFQVVLELRISTALRAGQQLTKRLTSARQEVFKSFPLRPQALRVEVFH